jgi:hypothetical protein
MILFSETFYFKQKRMRFTIVLILILFSLITYSQDWQDIIKIKSGIEIQCQILQVYETDSLIQFCIKEQGELKVKRIYTSLVDYYKWPGKDQAGAYCKMLGVNNKSNGEMYGADPYGKSSLLPHELTSTELAAMELKKAQTLLRIGVGATSLGLMTAFAGPFLLNEPSTGNSPYSYADDLKQYDNKYKTIQFVGYGLIAAGTLIELTSIQFFQEAKSLRQESQKGLSLSLNRDGLCLVLKF